MPEYVTNYGKWPLLEIDKVWGFMKNPSLERKRDLTRIAGWSRVHPYEMMISKKLLMKLSMCLPELGEGTPSTVDEFIEVNLGTDDDPRPTFLSKLLPDDLAQQIIQVWKDYRDCFAYSEMPGLSPERVSHKLSIDPNASPVKQAPRPDIKNKLHKKQRNSLKSGSFEKSNILPG